MSASVSQRQEFDFFNRFHSWLSSPFSLSMLLFPRLLVLHTTAGSFQLASHLTKATEHPMAFLGLILEGNVSFIFPSHIYSMPLFVGQGGRYI